MKYTTTAIVFVFTFLCMSLVVHADDVEFSHERGYYENSFSLELDSDISGATIRYALNGAALSTSIGQVYTTPIPINTNTSIRAIAYSNIDTSVVFAHTYIFIDDIISQVDSTIGFPTGTGMSQSIQTDPQYGHLLDDALTALPAVFVSLEQGDYNYIYTTKGELKPSNIEFFDAASNESYGKPSGVQTYGGTTFSSPQANKKNYRFKFREEYGAKKFKHPIFGKEAVDEFDSFDLRAGGQETFDQGGVQNVHEKIMKDWQIEMSQYGVHTRFVHVYINAVYWGVYTLSERPENSFGESYFSGKKEDFNVIKADTSIDGTIDSYRFMESQVTNYPAIEQYLHIDGFIDWVILSQYGPNGDWTPWNTYAIDNPTANEPFRFFIWDIEPSFENDWYYTNNYPSTSIYYEYLWKPLIANLDFKRRFADSFECNCLDPNGTLHPANAERYYTEVFDAHSLAYLAESARWADNLYDDFLQYRQDLVSSGWFYNRLDLLKDGYRSPYYDYYPLIDGVQYSSPGGAVSSGTSITLSNPNSTGTIYYTTDGTDPIASDVLINGGTWVWAGPNGFTANTREITVSDLGLYTATYTLGGCNYSESMLVSDNNNCANNSIICYANIASQGWKNVCDVKLAAGQSVSFGPISDILGGTWAWRGPNGFTSNNREITVSDIGTYTIIYTVNGCIYSKNIHVRGDGCADDTAVICYANIAGQGWQSLCDVQLSAGQSVTFGPAVTSSGISPSAQAYSASISLPDGVTEIRARIRIDGNWSAMCPRRFYSNIDYTGLVINEIMYHPDDTCSMNADEMDYIEIFNTSNTSINLTDTEFACGFNYTFPMGTSIAPGDYFVLAENADTFNLHYGFMPDAQFKGGLSNDGEEIVWKDISGNTIDSVKYNDINPWDEHPDGNGPSLELLDPTSDNADPISWFRSDNLCGTPAAANSRVCTSTSDIIVINEINYNSNNGITDPGDWVELHNPNATPVDISDWSFYDNGNEFIFPAGTIIQPDQYLVLVEDDAMFTGIFPHLTANEYIGNFSFGLSNKGERISLFNKDKCLSDYVVYNDRIPWDTIPDGNGPTLSLITPDSDNVLPESWEASSNINSAYGTPGRANTPCPENALWLPDPICAGFPAEIKVDSAYSDMDYTWFASGATPFNFTTDSETLTWNNSGNYNLQLITKYYECTKVYTQAVTVTDCNTISITNDNFSTNEDNILSDNILTNDNDAENNNLILNTTPQTNVSNGTLIINPDGTFDYTPNPNFNGTDSFTYQVCDDASVMTTVPQNFVTQVASGADDVEERSTDGSINVTSSDLDILEDPPSIFSAIGIRMTNIAIPQGAAITGAYLEFVADESQNVATSIDISAEAVGNALAIPTTPYSVSSKPRTSATISWANIPAWGKGNTYKTADIGNLVQEIINRSDWTSGNAMTFILEGTGVRTAESFEADIAPKLVITYGSQIPTDVSLCDEATVTINVTPENDVPQALNDNITIAEDSPSTNNTLTNDSDIDGDNLAANTTPITPPQNGLLIIQPNGLYTYTPNPDFFGTDMFEYEVCDDGNPSMCDTASVTVNVTPINDVPTPAPDTLMIFANSAIQDNVLLNDSDIENDNLTAMIVPMVVPANGSVTIQANGSINYTPNPNFVGTDSFTYEVCDDGSPVMCSTGTVVIIIEPDCVDIELYAWLEGAYDPALGEMRNTLVSSRKLLPGQTPASNLAVPTPAGQPYSGSPWNYAGTEGAAWTDADYTGNETDWVLASFRTGTAKSTEVGMTAGLLMKDGSIEFPDRCALTSTVASPLYIVLEHRNHIGIMTPQPVDLIGSTLTYDFRLSDSFRDPTSFGQKLLPTGEWTMFAGDADQSDFPSFDIQGTDKTIWFDNNGIFDYYFSPDFNLDGDINGQDKSLWFDNNGISSRVPK